MLVRNKIQDLLFTKQNLEALYEEYGEKNRGEIFIKKLSYWERKLKYQLHEIKQIGKGCIGLYELQIINKEGIEQVVTVAYSQEFSPEDIMELVQIETKAKQINSISKAGEIKLGVPI